MSVKEFNLAIEDFSLEVLKEVQKLQKLVAQQVFAGLIYGTPRDTTEASRQWLVTIDSPSTEKREGTYREGLGVIKSAPLFATIWITNNSDYILVLEDGLFVPPDPGPSKDRRPERRGRILVSGGFSTQAPKGIVGPIVDEVELIFGP